jgi:AICAR transformylase/IMP cyclohydrolase PurH
MKGWGDKMDKTSKEDRKQYRTQVKEEFPDTFLFGNRKFKKKLPMRYGENPGYPAAFYSEKEASGPNMATIEVLQEGTKGLSYINIGDMDLGQRLVKKLTDIYEHKLICVLVKHEMPSGVARGESPETSVASMFSITRLPSRWQVSWWRKEGISRLSMLLILHPKLLKF